ncbi:MAG TPA: Tar ligand binding domain-containing protein, partial [Anaeromyxobacteraceae bacterium]|nr:Tar ligand binding domain-containing protein [Anaeromyxobacteraceae bacterium]
MFRTVHIRTQILCAFGVVAGACLASGVGALLASKSMASHLAEVAENRLPAAEAVARVDKGQVKVGRALAVLFRRRMEDPELRRSAHRELEEAMAEIASGQKEFESLQHQPATLAAWRDYSAKAEAWQKAATDTVALLAERNRLLEAGRDMDTPEQKALYERTFQAWRSQNRSFLEADGAVRAVRQANAGEVALATASGGRSAALIAWLLPVALALAALVLVGSAWLLMRNVTEAISATVAETAKLRDAVTRGELASRADAATLHPDFRQVVEGFNQVLEAFGPLQFTISYLERFARGEVPQPLLGEYQGDFAKLQKSMAGVIATIQQRGRDVRALIEAAEAGNLSFRADTSRYHGYNGKLLESINSLIDRLLKPLELSASHFERIAQGDIPPRIEEEWKGDLDRVRTSLNRGVDAVNALVADASRMAEASALGKLDARADASRHHGDFRKIVEGMNASLDALAKPVAVAAQALERISRGDPPAPLTEEFQGSFDEMRQSLNRVIEALAVLDEELSAVTGGVGQGDLAKRARPERARGAYRRILEGMNGALDGLAAPVNEAMGVLEKLSHRDLRVRMRGDFHGDHARLKEVVDATGDSLQQAMTQVAGSVEQLSAASSQIAASSRSVADGASQQASSIEETSSSLESMAS